MTLEFRDSAACKEAGITYHMALASEWEAQRGEHTYTPSAFAADGFIHCTNGLDLLEWVGNQFYTNSPDERTVLVVKTDAITSDVRYDDPDEHFPHIYGPINTAAVIGELKVIRGEDGAFTHIGS
ncbi:MAG: DUF952 domain-containing protein [Thermomicrobiales bacterium]|nr:DUF952 domain-containing protein [Thermomicrobiales bacterium]